MKFIEAAKIKPYFSNTIFVFVGDHGIRGDAGNMFPKCWTEDGITTQHVPLLFYAPGILQPQRLSKTCSQNDLLPSVAGLLNINYTNTTLGRNLFDTTQIANLPFANHAFLFDPDNQQIGMMTDDYCFLKNLVSGKQDFSSAKNNLPLPGTAEADKKQLEVLTNAWYQTAKYLILNNKKSQ